MVVVVVVVLLLLLLLLVLLSAWACKKCSFCRWQFTWCC
jgi:hypothetical protein